MVGIGGVFFRAKDADALRAWYAEHLGIDVQDGAVRRSRAARPCGRSSPATPTTSGPSGQQSMVNYRVSDLDAMLAQLREAGVPVEDKIEEGELGRFGWATDPEGNRFELWQPPR